MSEFKKVQRETSIVLRISHKQKAEVNKYVSERGMTATGLIRVLLRDNCKLTI